MNKPVVAVFFGGMSSEHDISCLSAVTVAGGLDREKYDMVLVGITKEGKWLLVKNIEAMKDGSWRESREKAALLPDASEKSLVITAEDGSMRKQRIDVAFPVLHGRFGEDGTIQGLFELAGIPYVGCGVLASAAAMDKATTKRIVEPLSIRQAKWVVVYRQQLEDMEKICDRIESRLPYTVFVKPATAGSSVGVSQAADREELKKALQIAAEQDFKVLVEETIIGHEVECAVLGNLEVKASQVGEILAADTFYTYEAKYSNPDSKTVVADYLPKETIEEIRDDAVRIFQALDGRGLARVDFFIEKATGEVVFNEINTFPGFTSISMYPTLWKNAGMDIESLVDQLVGLGMTR